MVLARVHPQLSHPHPHPEPVRITGLSVTIMLNLVAVILLSLPNDFVAELPARVLPEPRLQAIPVVDVTPVKMQDVPELELPKPKPKPLPTTDPLPAPVTQPMVERTAMPLPTVAMPPLETSRATETVSVTLAPPAVQVGYRTAPPPRYPVAVLRAGVEGTVTLKVLVDIDGWPRQVEVENSSGNRALDRAALEQVQQRWRFEPAMYNGRAVEVWALIPIDFIIPR